MTILFFRLVNPLEGFFGSLKEAIDTISPLYAQQRYVAQGPRGRFSVFPIGEYPWGHDENWNIRRWPLDQIAVFLPPNYVEQPGSAVESFSRPPDLQARADEALDGLEDDPEVHPEDPKKSDI
jgi:hypothetical protein